ncbi:S-adenosyl-L-methionine-dependent methyltransferase [Schizophyllum commune]
MTVTLPEPNVPAHPVNKPALNGAPPASGASSDRVQQLRSLVQLISEASERVISGWEAEAAAQTADTTARTFPPHDLYEARQVVVSAGAMLVDLVQDPQIRILELGSQYYEARALHIAVEKNVADILATAPHGLPLDDLAARTGVKAHKLGRILRALCSIHVFAEVKPGVFANNHTSQALVGNEGLQSMILSMGGIRYKTSASLPTVLFDPVRGQSESNVETAFQEDMKTDLPCCRINPALEYPWESLGEATVVDVGGGIGSMCLDSAKRFPKLKFIVQDLLPVVQSAPPVWNKELPGAIESGRVQFMEHDFFNEQPVKGADIYHMRYILHDWDDDRAVRILQALRPALLANPRSRLLICDQVMNTTHGCDLVDSAPKPLPANYGYATRLSHMLDLNMMTMFNGRERTAEELAVLSKRAGLVVERIFRCPSLVWLTQLKVDENWAGEQA